MRPLPNALIIGLGQLLRYGLSGLAINAALYGIYLLLTLAGLGPLAASSLVFFLGVPVSLWVHGRVSFRARAVSRRAVGLFWATYLLGYGVNIGTLALLHHGLGLIHEIAQLCAMGLVALVLFAVQKRLVFRA